MSIAIQDLNVDLFGSRLKLYLAKLNRDELCPNLIKEVWQLCSIRIEEFDRNKVEFNELHDLSEIKKCTNIEVVARWREYLFRVGEKDKKYHLQEAVKLYFDIFKKTKEHRYLIHGLSLVNLAKGIFADEIESIYRKCKKVVEELEYPAIQRQVLEELSSIFYTKIQDDFEHFLYGKIEEEQQHNNYSGVEHLIGSLFVIKAVNASEYKIMLAENYEKEGDFHFANKKPNTFYPSILITYQKALRELKSVECSKELRKRIEGKVLKEQKENARMHFAVANYYSEIDASQFKLFNEFGDSYLNALKIEDFYTGYYGLLAMPIDLVKSFTQHSESNKKFLSTSFLSGSHRIDSKGKTVGKCSIEKSDEILGRMLWRESMINFIIKSKWIMNEDKIASKGAIYHLLFKKCNSLFIPEERKILFAEGIYAGFADDFILASHLLMPQIENSLKFFAENCGIVTAKIYDEIQHDNMLGGILDKIIDKYQYELFIELKDFLIENNSVNFRNELSHGLLYPSQIEHYGVYLWWLCLKMITDTEQIFEKMINTKH